MLFRFCALSAYIQTGSRVLPLSLIEQHDIRVNHPLRTCKLYGKHEFAEKLCLAEKEVRYQPHIRFRLP